PARVGDAPLAPAGRGRLRPEGLAGRAELAGRALRPRRVLGQAGGGRGGPADPLVLPRLVELLVVAPGLVDRGQLSGDLLPVRPASAGHLVGADVDLPPGSGALNPAV